MADTYQISGMADIKRHFHVDILNINISSMCNTLNLCDVISKTVLFIFQLATMLSTSFPATLVFTGNSTVVGVGNCI